jgi:hypothetical protein
MATPFPKIAQLDLPNPVQSNPIDFRPLGEIGNTIADYRRKQQIADVLSGATDARGNLDVERAGALLSKIGALDEARPMLALAQQKAALAQHAGQAGASLSEQTRHNQAVEALARQQFEEGKLPPGAMPDPNVSGGLQPRPGYLEYLQGSTNAKTPEGSLYDQETLKALAEQARAGDTSVFTNVGRGIQGAQNLVRLRQEITRQNAGVGTSGAEQAVRNAEFQGEKAGQRTVAVRGANVELPANEFQRMAPLALEASSKVNRTQFPSLNAAILAWERGTGDENVVNLAVGANTLATIYARAVSPTGVPTDDLRKKGLSLLDQAFSKGQFSAAVSMMQREIGAAQQAVGEVKQGMRQKFLSGQQSGQPPQPTVGQIPIPGDAVRMLQNDRSPNARANFDAAFGTGAADRILGPQR